MSKIVIVTGSRDWEDAGIIERALDSWNPNAVVEGGARGADRIAREWARRNGIHLRTHHARWDKHGKAAGVRRNIEMLVAYPGALVLAFPLSGGRGTQHCIKAALEREMQVLVYGADGYGINGKSWKGFV